MDHVYAGVPELKLLKKRGGKSSSTTVLMGAWLKVLEDRADGWLKVRAFGHDGWVRDGDTSQENIYLKLFFVDVGQGDGCLIESPKKRLLVDGGQYARNLRSYLTNYKYKYLIAAGFKVHIHAVVVSHFDADHFAGLTSIIKDDRFTFGAVYHSGIGRFDRSKAKRPAAYDKHIGRSDAHGKLGARATLVETSFSSLDDGRALLAGGGLMASFRDFLEAVTEKNDAGELQSMQRITSKDTHLPGFDGPDGLVIEVLGPVPLADSAPVAYPWLKDESHTINGHSLVLKLCYGERTILLGGDLNTHSQEYLLHEMDPVVYRADVAKSCHHGASEFTVDFLEAVNPYATVFSSGDNENYAHPRADALGATGKYSRGQRPLILSTELGRSHKGAERIHYGLINCRTDGQKVVLAQMLEKAKRGDMWDAYSVP